MIVVRFKKTFPLRVGEWLMAGILLNWGLILLMNPDVVFQTTPQFAELARMAPQNTWGWACFLMGALRFTVLLINGAWRASPHIRSLCAFATCFFWLQISWGLLRTGMATTGLALYPWFLLLDTYNVFRASADARIADDKARGLPV